MEKVQIFPSKQRIVPNCKLAKVTANLNDEKFSELIGGDSRNIVEKKKHKKHGAVRTAYTIKNAEGYDDTDPLTIFDYDVLSACISEMEAGNRYTTPAIILRALTGKDNRENGNGKIHKDQRAAILKSITKMMGLILTVDLTDTNKKLGYDCEKEILTSAILPCKYVTKVINGQVVEDTIHFLDESPIMTVARSRNQILRYDTALLDVPNQNNTPLVITLKNYVIQRVLEIKQHKMTPTLTFDDIFKKARITDKSRMEKLRAREYILEFFKHLQVKGEIKSFELTKKGNTFHSIKFTF